MRNRSARHRTKISAKDSVFQVRSNWVPRLLPQPRQQHRANLLHTVSRQIELRKRAGSTSEKRLALIERKAWQRLSSLEAGHAPFMSISRRRYSYNRFTNLARGFFYRHRCSRVRDLTQSQNELTPIFGGGFRAQVHQEVACSAAVLKFRHATNRRTRH